ncbi:uncharacterized protein LOC124491090 [Dermatophagoides farinae]|uniref:uncharacterized protein LOC124491090 n=1 Tax=Dermatophagoides farinae TaxID=6954 RepID=UPI003F5E9B7A
MIQFSSSSFYSSQLCLLFIILVNIVGDCFVVVNNNNTNRGKIEQDPKQRNDTIIINPKLGTTQDDIDLIKDFDNEFGINAENDDDGGGGGGHIKLHNGLIVLIAKPFKLPPSSSSSSLAKPIMMPIIIEATRDVNNKNLIKWNVVNHYHRYRHNNNNNNNNNKHRQSTTINHNNNNELISPLSSRGRFWSPKQAKLARFKFLNFRKRFFPL